MAISKAQIRKRIRARRRALSAKQSGVAAQQLSRTARRCARLWQANRILAYRAFEGEISPLLLLNQLRTPYQYLPRISHYGHHTMRFYSARRLDNHNRYGILEPSPIGSPIEANQLDVILLPLVAFDRLGSRVGMGAGFYDRALASLAHQPSTRPFLVGVAHAFQEVNNLPADHWDIPLNAILTDCDYIPVKPK